MSFILDALRKSEHERQRQTGPGLAEPDRRARPKTNVWAAAAIALLVVNLLAVGVYLLLRAQKADVTATAASTTAVAPATRSSGVAHPPDRTAAAQTSPQAPVTQGAAPPRGPPASAGELRQSQPFGGRGRQPPEDFEPGLQSRRRAAPRARRPS